MIEQNPMVAKRPMRDEDAHIDEARLRQQAIGVKLRQMFDSVVQEPVPDEFLEILRRADDPPAKGDGSDSGEREGGGSQ